jgi:hypothetical protein
MYSVCPYYSTQRDLSPSLDVQCVHISSYLPLPPQGIHDQCVCIACSMLGVDDVGVYPIEGPLHASVCMFPLDYHRGFTFCRHGSRGVDSSALNNADLSLEGRTHRLDLSSSLSTNTRCMYVHCSFPLSVYHLPLKPPVAYVFVCVSTP